MSISTRLAGLAIILVLAPACSSLSPAPTANPPTQTPVFAAAAGDNPTAGAIRRATRQAQSTLSSQGTATAAGRATQTAMAQAAAAATVAARATGQAIVAAKSAWPRRVLESFSDNQQGWPVGLTHDHSLAVTSTVAGGQYQWVTKVDHGNSYFNLVPNKGPVLTDFYAGVSVQFGPGNDDGQSAYGLVYRQVKNDYGFFGIQKSGAIRELEVHGSGVYQLTEETSSAVVTSPGSTNRIAVAAVGSDFVFLVNDQVVGQMGAGIAPGQIGLGVDALTSAGPAQVDFADFEIFAP